MNSEKEEIIELRLSFAGPDPVGSKTRVMAVVAEIPELAGSLGIVEGVQEGQDLDHVDPATVFSDQEDFSNVSIFFGSLQQAADLLKQIKSALGEEQSWKAETRTIRNTTWKNAWDGEFKPFKTALFDIIPFAEVENFHTEKGRHLIAIDPGQAFGTGQHATTLACILALEKIWGTVPPGETWPWNSFLDVGTGTGILGITAAKTGATRIDATEIDTGAVAIARKNAQLNNATMNIIETAFVPSEICYDLVISNVLTEALVPLIPDLVAVTQKKGRLLLAGYTENDAQRFTDIVESCGGVLCFEVNVRGWVCQVFTKTR